MLQSYFCSRHRQIKESFVPHHQRLFANLSVFDTKKRPLMAMLSVLTCLNISQISCAETITLTNADIKKPTTTPTIAKTPVSPTIPTYTRLASPLAVNQLPDGFTEKIAQAKLPADGVSLLVQPLDGKSPLLSFYADTPRVPASTQKLIPTFVALDSLGKDFRWQTELWTHGVIIGDRLKGDVIVKGSGAPKLDDDQLQALLGHLALRGIRHIDGNVIVDVSRFRNVDFDVNAFDRRGLRPYNAMPNALLVNFGTITVDLSPNDRLAQSLTKNTPITAVPNAVTTALSKQANALPSDTPDTADSPEPPKPVRAFSQVNVTLTPKLADFDSVTHSNASQQSCRGMSEEKLIKLSEDSLKFLTTPSANCGETQSYWLTYPNADKMAVKAVSAHIHQQFNGFSGQVLLSKDGKLADDTLWQRMNLPNLIAVVDSAPLSEQISDINHYSNNVMTEQLALSLPIYANGETFSTYPKTFDFIHSWWQKHLPNHTAPIMTRASGLCRDCQVKPSSLLAVLMLASKHPDFNVYKTSLPLAGVNGTMKHLKNRQPNNPSIGRAFIKTGTLDNVSSMAGYVQGQSGKWYAVVAMLNAPNVKDNTAGKTLLDDFLWWTASQ